MKAGTFARFIHTEEHKIEQKLRLLNHTLMIILATILMGVYTNWELSGIACSASGPTLFMEFIDFWFGL